MRSNLLLLVYVCALILIGFNPLLAGQSAPAITVVHSFTGVGTDKEDLCCFAGAGTGLGMLYARLVQGRDGNFYGTSGAGDNKYGDSIFKITPGGVLTVLYRFTGKGDDEFDVGPGLVMSSDGDFYGTTQEGGDSGGGAVFKITPAGVFTVLHNFNDGVREECTPVAGLVQGRDGNFYGTTYLSGDGRGPEPGTVFKITPAGVLTTLHRFAGKGDSDEDYNRRFTGKDAEGAHPACLVQGRDGNFYGTTFSGGSRARGTIFKITPAGRFTTLHSFTGKGTEGVYPCPGLAQGSDGNFYGATTSGGASNDGTVFQITPAGGFTTLHSFTQNGADGSGPNAGLVEGSDGNLYGTTGGGGASYKGTVFRIRMKDEG